MIRPHRIALAAACLMLPLIGGCQVLGLAAAKLPEPETMAQYPGLAGQRVAVMSWADRALRYDYETLGSNLQTKVALATVQKFKIAQDSKVEELVGTTFVDARQVYKWQQNRPELEGHSLSEIAPKLAAQVGATRIIYVEIQDFHTRDPRTDMLLKGVAVFDIKVAEVAGPVAKVVYEESNITVQFPDRAPEGVPPTESMTQQHVYDELVNRLTGEVAKRFFSHYPGA